jgi:hypothetical protein
LANPTLKQVSQYIFQNIRQLEAQGHIVIANQKGQLYKVVDEGHLKEAVLRIIQELLDSKTHFIGK